MALAAAWRATGTLCPFALITGIPCPGCGLGRAVLALSSGHPVEALHFHPLVFVVPAVLALAAASWGRAPSAKVAAAIGGAVLVAAVSVWIARFDGAFGGPAPVHSIWAKR